MWPIIGNRGSLGHERSACQRNPKAAEWEKQIGEAIDQSLFHA